MSSQGNIISEDFSTVLKKESSTAVWNFELGVIHPTLQIKDYQFVFMGPTFTAPIDVGDGSHGAFEPTTYANFGSVIGNVITVDANVFPVLKLTRFQLDSGYTLTSINGPLIIYSLSTVIIDGTILCSGTNGSAASGASGGAGGIGRCGGFNGGAGGNSTAGGSAGSSPANLVSGGGGGGTNVGATGSGGGGAGSYSTTSGGDGINSVGSGGLSSANDDFTIFNGSPGGGGGSGSNTQGGGGGGGGGGTVVIHAVGNVTLSATGFVLALGGNGGGANTGGGGGGGGGGSIKIFTAGIMYIETIVRVDVTEGSFGVAGGGGGNGGLGSFGRTWLPYSIIPGGGSESHISALTAPGTIEYVTTTQTVISKSYDTQSNFTEFSSITGSPTNSDFTFEISGSRDNFVTDDTGWLNATQISGINNKRYIKYKMTLTNSNAALPTTVSAVFINFNVLSDPNVATPIVKEMFKFKSGCGSVNWANWANSPPVKSDFILLNRLLSFLLLFLLLLFPLFIAMKLRLKTFRSDQKY